MERQITATPDATQTATDSVNASAPRADARSAARHVISIADLAPADVDRIVQRSVRFAVSRRVDKTLADKVVGIYFTQPSTRTRTAFTVGALTLGASTITYGPRDLQTTTGETASDTARVLAGYLDGLVIRSDDAHELHTMADQDEMAVINALTESEHPTQALADLSAITEQFGRVAGLSVVYVGQGNNTAAALALALARIRGTQLVLVSPLEYGLPASVLHTAQTFAATYGSDVQQRHTFDGLTGTADVIYTTRWQSLGTRKHDEQWREAFAPYAVTRRLVRDLAKSSRTVVMHDLPAVRGEEIEDEVLDAADCIAFRQARHKMFSAMAILEWSLRVLA